MPILNDGFVAVVTDQGGHLTPGKQMSQPTLGNKKNSAKELSPDSRNESGTDISETPSTHKVSRICLSVHFTQDLGHSNALLSVKCSLDWFNIIHISKDKPC